MKPRGDLCVRCKGYRLLCGLQKCPVLERFRSSLKAYANLKPGNVIEGSTPPSALVGEKGYPRVPVMFNVAPTKSLEEALEYENPQGWWGRKGLMEIVSLRSSLVSGIMRVLVSNPWELYEKEHGLACISEKPVYSTLELEKRPTPILKFDSILKPLGIASPAKSIIVEDNPRIPSKLEKLIWDDARTIEALWEAYKSGVDTYLLKRALSLGFLGRIRNRRLVPTRWAITAVDDMLSRVLLRRINNYKSINEFLVYAGEYLHNKFVIVLAPGGYRGFWLEAWYPGSAWGAAGSEPSIHVVEEDSWGRQTPPDGGFSAARLPVVEHLYRIGRRAIVFILREVYPEYIVPVGNWHIRETVKKALQQEPIKPETPRELLRIVGSILCSHAPLRVFEKILAKALGQKTIDEYMR